LCGCSALRVSSPPVDYRLAEHEEAFARALAHYAQGLILEGEHGTGNEAALEHYVLAEEYDPGHSKPAAKVAFSALRCRELDLAIETLERAAGRHPHSAAIQVELGTVYRFAERLEESAACYLKAIRLDPANPFPYQAVAAIRFLEKNDDEAFDLLRRGCDEVEAPDRLLDFCRRQGTSFLREGEVDRAIPCFALIAGQKASVRREIFHLIGELHVAADRKTEALRYYRLAANQDKPLADTYVKIAGIQQENDLEAAIGTLREAITKFPGNPMFVILLGEAYDRNGSPDEAEEQFERACGMEPPLADAFVKLAVVHLKDSTEKALATLARGRERLPDAVPIIFAMATINGIEKRYDEAFALFERIREIADASDLRKPPVRYYLQYAGTCEEAGLKAKAESILREGLRIYPNEDRILNFLAYMWAEQGANLNEALAFSLKTLEEDPDNAAYVDTLGWIYFKLEKYELALERLKQANALQADEPTLLDHLGDVYSALGQADKAVIYWKQSFKIDPKNRNVETKLKAKGIDTTALRREREDRGEN